jgi:hypothetical protein
MTQKDYIALAAIIANARRLSRAPHNWTAAEVIDNISDNLTDMLASDNPRFSRVRFEAACNPAGDQS